MVRVRQQVGVLGIAQDPMHQVMRTQRWEWAEGDADAEPARGLEREVLWGEGRWAVEGVLDGPDSGLGM